MGNLSINCDDRGDKYHIVSDACFVLLLINEVFDCRIFEVLISHPIRTPAVTIKIGIIFIYVGSMKTEDLIGDIHDIILPAEIDRAERRIIGIMIIIFSVMLIILALDWDDHIVATLNRME